MDKRLIHLADVGNWYNDNDKTDYIQIRLFNEANEVETMELTVQEAFDLSFKLKAMALDMKKDSGSWK